MKLVELLLALVQFLKLACLHVRLGLLSLSLDLVEVPISLINEALETAPIRFRRLRGFISISLRPALAPVRVVVENADMVLCLRSARPSPDVADAAWKDDFLFLDMVTRLARREIFHTSTISAPNVEERSRVNIRSISTPGWLSLRSYIGRSLAGLLNVLVHVEMRNTACRFEDAPVPEGYRGSPGFGFALTARLESLVSTALRQPVVGIRSRGFHRVVHLSKLEGFYDAGVARTGGEYVARVIRTDASLAPVKEEVPVMDYVPSGYLPFIVAHHIDVNARLDGVSLASQVRFLFCDGLVISLRDYEFQAGLASILRIPLFLSSRLALGASRDSLRDGDDAVDQSIERYRGFYRAAVKSRMRGAAARKLTEFEAGLDLDECLALRNAVEDEDLRNICRKVHNCTSSDEVERTRSALLSSFSRRIHVIQSGKGDLSSNDWGVSDAESSNPSLSLHFEFPKILVNMKSSSSHERTGVRALPRFSATMTDTNIDVFDAVARAAVVVGMDVGSLVAKTDEGHPFLECLGEQSSFGPFMTMRFRQDGMLSPAVQSLKLRMSHIHAFAVADQLRFILEFFVPLETPRSYALRRRILRTIATVRRRRAHARRLILPLPAVELAPMLDIVLSDVRCHVASKHVDADYFAAFLRGKRLSGVAPVAATVITGFRELSIVTIPSPAYRLDAQRNFELTSAIVGEDRIVRYEPDPASAPVASSYVEASDVYDGFDQVAAISINIHEVNLDLVTPTSLGHATDQRVVDEASVRVVVMYVGAVFSTPFRTDAHVEASFGPSGEVHVRSESISELVDVVGAFVAPVADLAFRLAQSAKPPPGIGEADLLALVAVDAYGPGGSFALSRVDGSTSVRQQKRRIVGDTQVQLGACLLVVSHLVELKRQRVPSAMGTKSMHGGALLKIAFDRSFIRQVFYTSLSTRTIFRLSGLRSSFSRGSVAVRRLVIPSFPVHVNVIQAASGDCFSERGLPVFSSSIDIDVGEVQVMGQTASPGTLRDLSHLFKSIHAVKESDAVAEDQNGSPEKERMADPPIVSRSLFQGLSEASPFTLRVAGCRSRRELGISSPDRRLAGVDCGTGTLFRFVRSPETSAELGGWVVVDVDEDSIGLGRSTSLLYVKERNDRRVVLDTAKVPEALWQVYGWDTRHMAFQSSTGMFLGINRERGEGITSPTPSFFEVNYVSSSTVCVPDQQSHPRVSCTGVSLACPSLRLHFGGGETHDSQGAVFEVSSPALLELNVDNMQISANQTRSSTGTGTQHQTGEWDIEASFVCLLAFRDLRSPSQRVSVLSPWTALLSAKVRKENPILVLHGDDAQFALSNAMLLQIASVLSHENSNDDDMSYFAFINRSDSEVHFRVLGGAAECDSSVNYGPQVLARPLERVPFGLPGSSMSSSSQSDTPKAANLLFISEGYVSPHPSSRDVRKGGPPSRRFSALGKHRKSASSDKESSAEYLGWIMLFVENYEPVCFGFGPVKSDIVELIPVSKKPNHVLQRQLWVNTEEDGLHGALRIELLSPLAVRNECPFPVDVFAHYRGRDPKRLCDSVSLADGEVGILASVWKDSFSISLEGMNSLGTLKFASVVGLGHGDGMYSDGPIWDAIASDGSDTAVDVTGPRHRDHLVRASPPGAISRVVLTSKSEGKRTVLHVAPLIIICNDLPATGVDVILDDGISIPSRVRPPRTRARWARDIFRGGGPFYGQDFIFCAVKVLSDSELPVVVASTRGEYRLVFRDVGGAWSDPVWFMMKGEPVSGKEVFSVTRSFGLGLVAVSGVYDDNCSLRIRISSRFVIKNRAPGVTLSVFTTATRVGSAAPARAVSKAVVIGRGRPATRKDVFPILPGSNLYFDDGEAYIGVQGIGQESVVWPKRATDLPTDDDPPATIRMPNPGGPGGVQLVVEGRRGGEVRIMPVVEVRNNLDVAVQIRSVSSAFVSAAFNGSSYTATVAPHSSASIHQEHHLLESKRSLSSVRLYVSSPSNFEESGAIFLEEEGTFPLAVKSERTVSRLETNTQYMVIGVDVFVAETSPRRVVRVLPSARYGPALNVVNHTDIVIFLSDVPNPKHPITRVGPMGSASSFAWSSVAPSKKQALFVSAALQSGHVITREVLLPRVDGKIAPNERGSDADTLVRFENSTSRSEQLASLPSVTLAFRLEPENGFMARMRVFDVTDGQPAPGSTASSRSAERRNELDMLQSGSALHVALPRISVSVKTVDTDLLSLRVGGVYCSVLRNAFKLRVGMDLLKFDVKNEGPNPWRKLVVTRATRGRGVDEHRPFVSLTTVSRLPHSRINPSDLWHMESIRFFAQPMVVNLESKFVDFAALYFVRIFSNLQEWVWKPEDVRPTFERGLEEDAVSFWKVPLFIGSDVVIADVWVNFSFFQNGRYKVGFVREERTRSLTSMLRALVVNVIPPIRDAQVRLRAPDLANGIYLSGQLSRKLASHGVKQGIHVLRSLLGNVAVLNAIELILLGRKRGDHGLRRFGRARAMVRQAAAHLKHDVSPASVESAVGQGSDNFVRYEPGDSLALHEALDVVGYSLYGGGNRSNTEGEDTPAGNEGPEEIDGEGAEPGSVGWG